MKELLTFYLPIILVFVAIFIIAILVDRSKAKRTTRSLQAAIQAPASAVEVLTHRCEKGGFLVGPSSRIPEDGRYFQTAGAKFLVGCNQLKCKLCGKKVRQQAGLRDISPEVATQHVREIFALPDLSQSPYVVAEANTRLYVCECSLVTVAGSQAFPFPNDTWSCAGHPVVEGGNTLPPMTLETARQFAVQIANSHLQQSLKAIALTYTDGSGLVTTPAHISLGAGLPQLQVWQNDVPTQVDFTRVAGGCLQSMDEIITAY